MFSLDRVRAKPSRSALSSWFIVPDRPSRHTHTLYPSVLQPLSFPLSFFAFLFFSSVDHTPCMHTHANRHTKTRAPFELNQMFCIKKQQGSPLLKPSTEEYSQSPSHYSYIFISTYISCVHTACVGMKLTHLCSLSDTVKVKKCSTVS